MQSDLGVALDIGTTTVKGRLLDLASGEPVAYFSSLNEQLPHGHDILSRIKFAVEKANGLERLQGEAVSSVNLVLKNLLADAKADRDRVRAIAAVGNTAMYHFTLAISPKPLIEPPYEPSEKALVKKEARALGIDVDGACEFTFLPNVGGFVGSDALAVIMASELDRSEALGLAVDIGTNGEIVLGSRRRIWAASTAAGPAFEGWHVKCGMRSTAGAIESIEEMEQGLQLKVIRSRDPIGISGSALIDIVAILLKRGYIDNSGAMKGNFLIFDGRRKKLFITANDVRQVQLAKAAFSAGITTLRKLAGGDTRGVDRFFLTGNFGKYVNRANAMAIGLIPQDVKLKRVDLLEDGALTGAEIFLKDPEETLLRIENILEKTTHISLSRDEAFKKAFIEAMRF